MTIGASDDIDKATKLARKMVTEFGMSALGPISFEGHQQSIWLARELGDSPSFSDSVASQIDNEIRIIIEGAYNKALEILKSHSDKLHLVANRLLEIETIYDEDFKALLGLISDNEKTTNN
jgi:cell division protease FtsH